MFDIGFSELLLIALVALVVLGPVRLPRAARYAGLWVRRARAQWFSLRSELERELAAEDLKRSLDEGRRALTEMEERLVGMHASVRGQVDGLAKQAHPASLSGTTDTSQAQLDRQNAGDDRIS